MSLPIYSFGKESRVQFYWLHMDTIYALGLDANCYAPMHVRLRLDIKASVVTPETTPTCLSPAIYVPYSSSL